MIDIETTTEEEPQSLEETRTIHPRNTLNALTGAEFLYHTRSVWQTSYPHAYGHDVRKAHGANKPPALMAELIETFTRPGMEVFDPFAGVGGTLIGAAIAKGGTRLCTGIEINPQWVDVYKDVCRTSPDIPQSIAVTSTMLTGDCLEIMDKWLEGTSDNPEMVQAMQTDFITFDPPYTVHLKQTMSGAKFADNAHTNRRSDYDMHSDDPRDFANLDSYLDYLDAMAEVFARCYMLLRDGRYMAVLISNTYNDGHYFYTSADLAKLATWQGFVMKGEIIWTPTGKRMRPYGYPTAWIPNTNHTTIIILQKPKGVAR